MSETAIRDLKVEQREVASLRPYAGNPRTHSRKQIRQIADSIRVFGWTNPILIDGGDNVIAGHGRLEAASLLGLEQVPTICISDMSEAQRRAYILADNRLAENAGWDRELLALELKGLLELDLDFEITATGFEMGAIDVLIGELDEPGGEDDADRLPDADFDTPPVSRPGDLWRLGPHRLLCGDALDPEAYRQVLDGEKAELVFTDPPYNVPIDGHVCGLGAVRHAEFAMATGEMSEAEFIGFLEQALGNMARNSADGAIHFICMDWRHIHELLVAGKRIYSELKNLCVWNKSNGGMGSLYRSKHELVAVFKAGTAPHINNVALGSHGRNRTNVWDYAGINSFGAERDEQLAMHPTVKPVAMVADAILDCSTRGGLVLDPFAGAGTTILAAERTGRQARAIELDPRYVDVALRRFETLTGTAAVHAASGETFAALTASRRQEENANG